MTQHNRYLNRRNALKLGGTTLMAAALQGFWPQPTPAIAATTQPSPETVLELLTTGNERFVAHHAQHPHTSIERMAELATGQHPIVTILSCADSRVPAELLFDLGLGDVFNVRVAGNIVTPEVLASIEYAVELLETPVLMILGHERCGAVTAAVQGQTVPGHIGDFIDEILPAVAQVKDQPGDAIDNAVRANVDRQIQVLLQQSDLIRKRKANGQVRVVGSRYDLDSGRVDLLA
ncbi:carbonic anhydrase [filamentous cyanobacterium LEGE 11480]|uniref:Carbonic anhydrase n=1 Tax=Romeriopsis navalis LEGE 11480 TaxID=2777977 RepID=A0A928Z366_9CYAN|nr:carbonic anhydrase [Romeriopsis navalis]MBE9029747.1 carbonic anhydrase [Romeriopsis navalis LEGE 11480]